MKPFNKFIFMIIAFNLFLMMNCTDIKIDPNEKKIIPLNVSPLLGKKIPDYELDAFHNGKITNIKLSDFKGKWLILFFYPADFTFVCPTELKEMSKYYKDFRETGAEVLAISTDSVFVHQAWHKHNKDVNTVQYPMLSDRSGKLSRALGTYFEDKGCSVRASFVVDPQGKIVAYEVHDDTIGRSAEELLRKLDAIMAVRKSDGSFCPANWHEGDALIKAD